MCIDIIGWDVGGAHLKAVALDRAGAVVGIMQHACPLWMGLDRLDAAVQAVSAHWLQTGACRHAMTMTGELADSFPDRTTGVHALMARMQARIPGPLLVFAGPAGLLDTTEVRDTHLELIASANWMASGLLLARRLEQGILIDIGSTTTDVIRFSNGQLLTRGYTDYERLRYDELVYMGIVRTPLMAIAARAPFEGGWVSLMNEHFATSADIFRLTGELPEHADQFPAADNGRKDLAGSARRLARMIGRDLDSAPRTEWIRLAEFFRSKLISRIAEAVTHSLVAPSQPPSPPLIGAGTGRFLVRAVAEHLGRPYRDSIAVIPQRPGVSAFCAADCMPAAAVALLARERL